MGDNIVQFFIRLGTYVSNSAPHRLINNEKYHPVYIYLFGVIVSKYYFSYIAIGQVGGDVISYFLGNEIKVVIY